MNVTNIVILVMTALFAGLFLFTLYKKGQIKKITGTLLFVLVMIILVATGLHFSRLSFSLLNEKSDQKAVISNVMEQLPLLKALQQYDLPAFNALNTLIGQSIDQGKTSQQITDQIRVAVTNLSAKRMRLATDDDVNQFVSVTLAQLDELKARKTDGYDLCFKSLFPGVSGGVNPLNYNSSELLQRRFESDGRMVTNSYLHPHTSTAEEQTQAQQQLKDIVQQMRLTYGDDLLVLAPPVKDSVDHEKACNITYDLYQRILALPSSQSASVIRYMMGSVGNQE